MKMPAHLLAIDQGTTSTRVVIFNELARPLSEHQIDLTPYFPQDGWVEHDPLQIWEHTLECCRQALHKIHLTAADINAIGIANQRETTIIWDRKSGAPIYRAIVWQDRRTADLCKELLLESNAQREVFQQLQAKTGLILDSYFSATKILWILDNVPNARQQADRGELAFGTVDTFLLWRLTNGRVHATDATNASRTLLFNIRTQQWDKEILAAFGIPENLLPVVLDSAADFGATDAELFGGAIPICAVIGDQQAATVGQTCFKPGMMKITYGTGGFMLVNTGSIILSSTHRLLSTIAYRLGGKSTYGLEGSIFSAGTAIKWLRDSLKLFARSSDTEGLAGSVLDNGNLYLVPAFTGLGAPYWDADARAAILGLTRASSIEQIVRAALESVCYQTRDLMECMKLDGVSALEVLHVDGGMSVNNWLLQFLADILNMTVARPAYIETTALGAVFFAGLQCGVYQSLEQISTLWQASASFTPKLAENDRERLYQGWKNAVARIVTQPE
jgi:glycerol kinase